MTPELAAELESLDRIARGCNADLQAALLAAERAEHAYRQAHALAYLRAEGTEKQRTAEANLKASVEMNHRNETRAIARGLESADRLWKELIRKATAKVYAERSEMDLVRS